MGVAVDAARQNQFAARVDLALAGRQLAADGGDGFADDCDVGLEHIACGGDASAADPGGVGGFCQERLRSVLRRSRTRKQLRTAMGEVRSCWTLRTSHSNLPAARKTP